MYCNTSKKYGTFNRKHRVAYLENNACLIGLKLIDWTAEWTQLSNLRPNNMPWNKNIAEPAMLGAT